MKLHPADFYILLLIVSKGHVLSGGIFVLVKFAWEVVETSSYVSEWGKFLRPIFSMRPARIFRTSGDVTFMHEGETVELDRADV